MAEGIGEVLTYAVGVAISPVPIIAVILMLFSARARVNGPMFLAGWVVALGVVSAVAYALADAGDVGTDSTASDTVSWGMLAVGVFFLLVAAKQWRGRPTPGAAPAMPKWMAGIDSLAAGKAFGLGAVLASANPKNLIMVVGAATGLAQLGLATSDVIVSAVVFVAVASLSVGGPVVYYLVGGAHSKSSLDELKGWLLTHNEAVMTVLFLVFGGVLISKGLAPLTE